MSESCAIEIYENERQYRRYGWVSYAKEPFAMKETLAPCKPLDEITVPSSEWQWSTNWKIIKMPGATDEDGWEYASKYSRFKIKNRTPKIEPKWCKARRRLWIRVMRREIGVKATEITKVLPRIQAGLTSINGTRKKIEEIMRYSPTAADTDEMRQLVTTVYRNIQEILSVIDQAEKQVSNPITTPNNRNPTNVQLPNPGILKKLKNEVLREQVAIERAIDPTLPSASVTPVTASQKIAVNNKVSFASSSGNNGSVASSLSSSYRSASFTNNNNSMAMQSRNSFRGGSIGSAKLMGFEEGRYSETRPSEFSTISEAEETLSLEQYSSKKKSSAVKSGSAKAFDPSMFANTGNNNNHIMITSRLGEEDEIEDGVFVDRSKQDLLISQKLIPIDETTVMQEIIDERSREIEKIHVGIVELNEMFKDLSRLVKEQEEEIGTICENIDTANAQTKVAFQQIVEANSLHQNGACIIC